MPTELWTLFGAASGAGCGCGALYWSHRMLQNRRREERLPHFSQRILVLAAAICGSAMGLCIGQWLPFLLALSVLTVGMAVSVTDCLCRIIPNPTVLALFTLKLLLIAAALLKIPGAPSFHLLSSMGGMAFCFVIFSVPGLMGKQVGAGDIKLAAAMGFLLEFNSALLAVTVMGLLILGYCMFQQRMPLLAFLKTNIPIGPFISAGMIFTCMVPYLTV